MVSKNLYNDGMKGRTRKSSGNIFVDLGFPPEEAAVLAMRANIMATLRKKISDNRWTQARAAKELGVAQSRVSDLVRGKWDKFSMDMLLMLATRAGLDPRLELAA
jgi:predicted XRE-type DNA-binding protein